MRVCTVVVACFLTVPLHALGQASSGDPASDGPLAPLAFLVGNWSASGGGQPGASAGELTFNWEADRHAMLRHNRSVTAGATHSDIMLICASPDGALHATYADSEGHSISYVVSAIPHEQRVVFESAGPGPRFRLWYQLRPDGSLATGFQVAQPGSTEFKTYLEGVAQRV